MKNDELYYYTSHEMLAIYMDAREQTLIEAITDGDLQKLEKVLGEDSTLVKINLMSLTLTESNYELKNPTPLHLAVYYSNKTDHSDERKKILSYLVANGADINYTSFVGHGPLHCAAKIGNVETLQFLIEQNANLELTDGMGRTPIFYAAGYGNEMLLQALISEGAKVLVKDKENNNPLHYAVMQNIYVPVVKVLIDHGVNIKESNDGHKSAFDFLINNNDMVSQCEVLKYYNNHEEFYDAIKSGDNDKVEKILASATPEVLSQLLTSLGTRLVKQGKINTDLTCTPLQLAAIFGHMDVIKTLLKYNFDSNLQDMHGNTALHYAAFFGHQEAFDVLLPSLKDIQVRNRAGLSILHTAANYKGSLAMLDVLIKKGLSVDERDYRGRTPLHMAQDSKIANHLISLGADKTALDDFSRSPFRRAANKGNRNLTRFLQTHIGSNQNLNQDRVPQLFKKPEAKAVARLIEEGKDLMKRFEYKEASDKFSKAYSIITQSTNPNQKLVDLLKEYIQKSMTLAQSPIYSYQHDSNNSTLETFDPVPILASRLRISSNLGSFPADDVYNCLREFSNNPLLKPYLDYVAMDFLLNEKAYLRITEEIQGSQSTVGFYRKSNIVAKAEESPLSQSQKGTIMHEITHYYHAKAYQNNSLPYVEGDIVKQQAHKEMMLEVLINIYKQIDPNVDETRLRTMDTWDLGKEAAGKDNQPSEVDAQRIRDRILSIYTGYSKEQEEIEFAVRLNDLLGQGYDIIQLLILKPFIKFNLTHLLPDCDKFNAEMFQIVADYYARNSNTLKT